MGLCSTQPKDRGYGNHINDSDDGSTRQGILIAWNEDALAIVHSVG